MLPCLTRSWLSGATTTMSGGSNRVLNVFGRRRQQRHPPPAGAATVGRAVRSREQGSLAEAGARDERAGTAARPHRYVCSTFNVTFGVPFLRFCLMTLLLHAAQP